MSIRLIGALLCGAGFVFITATGASAGQRLTIQQALVGGKISDNESPLPQNRTTARSGKSNTGNRIGGGGGTKGACPRDMVAKGNSCIERERGIVRNIPGGGLAVPTDGRDVTRNSNRMGGGGGTGKPKALSDPPRGGPGPIDLPGRR
jgi:hypothetical protein